MSRAPRSFRACLRSREKREWNNACSAGYFISLVYPFRNHWRFGKSASGSQQYSVIYSQIVPFFALNRIFFPANEKETLKRHNQTDFKSRLK